MARGVMESLAPHGSAGATVASVGRRLVVAHAHQPHPAQRTLLL